VDQGSRQLILKLSEPIRAHRFVTERGFETIKAKVLCGKILYHKKQSLRHGRWIPWVRANLDFTERTAQYYLKLYEYRDQVLQEQPQSLLKAIALLSDTKRLTPGLLSGDEKILRGNIVRQRLKRLPRHPIHYETVAKIMGELNEELMKLLDAIS
jgi:hypothetical protein